MSPSRFRQIRERLGLTQEELARILGLSSYLSITHYESGFRNPSRLIAALMEIFDELPEKKSAELRTLISKKISEQRDSRQQRKQ